MAHEPTGALQQSGRVRQRCAIEESNVYVLGEHIDVAEGRVSQTCDRTAVMQELTNFVPAFSHYPKPLVREGSQFTRMFFHPRINGGIALDCSVEPQQLRSHRSIFFSRDLWLRTTLYTKDKRHRFRVMQIWPNSSAHVIVSVHP